MCCFETREQMRKVEVWTLEIRWYRSCFLRSPFHLTERERSHGQMSSSPYIWQSACALSSANYLHLFLEARWKLEQSTHFHFLLLILPLLIFMPHVKIRSAETMVCPSAFSHRDKLLRTENVFSAYHSLRPKQLHIFSTNLPYIFFFLYERRSAKRVLTVQITLADLACCAYV